MKNDSVELTLLATQVKKVLIHAAKAMVDALVIEKTVGEEVKDQLFETIEKVLDKLTLESPLLERIMYLFSRFASQELGNREKMKLHGHHKELVSFDTAYGYYNPTFGRNVTLAMGSDIQKLLSQSNAYLEGKVNTLPNFYATMLHEVLHLLIDKFFQNAAKMSPPSHIGENWRKSENMKKRFQNDFAIAEKYVRSHPNDEQAKAMFEEIVKSFSSEKKRSKAKQLYTPSMVLMESPTLFITSLVLHGNPRLLEEMFPNTATLLIDVLNEMVDDYNNRFPNSRIEHYHPHSPLKSHLDLTIESKLNENLQKTTFTMGFFNSTSESADRKRGWVMQQLDILTENRGISWNYDAEKKLAWSYLNSDQYNFLQRVFAEKDIKVQFTKVDEKSWVVQIDENSFEKIKLSKLTNESSLPSKRAS